MTDEKKLKLYKALHILYFVIEFLIFLSPVLFILISNMIDVNIIAFKNKMGHNADKIIALYEKLAETQNGEVYASYWTIIKGWRFGVVILFTIFGGMAYFWILWNRIITKMKTNSAEIKERIKNKNIIEMFDMLTLKQKAELIKTEELENETK